jgi:hypothetical protein
MSYNVLKLSQFHFNAYVFPHVVFRIRNFTVIINLYTFGVKIWVSFSNHVSNI